MLRKGSLALLVGLVLAAAAWGVVPAGVSHYIVQENGRFVYVDLGQRDGAQEGDLLDIVTTEVIQDPLGADTLAAGPKNVGALRLRQVFENLSLAEVLQLDQGSELHLMQVAPVQDPERLAQLQALAMAGTRGSGQAAWRALVPGLHQYQAGARARGMVLAGSEVAALAAGIGFRLSSNDWHRRYEAYNGADVAYVVELGQGMQRRRRWSNRFFWLSAGLYVGNLMDVRWTEHQSGGSPAPALGMGFDVDGDGRPLLCLVRTF